jgi:hypothetical protein
MKHRKKMPLDDNASSRIVSDPVSQGTIDGLKATLEDLKMGGQMQVFNYAADPAAKTKSWVIWLKDGRYSYAWGETEQQARENWLANFASGVLRVVPAGEYTSALPTGSYLREMNGQI